jgi:DNA (cytosine-5)-methyltransferase 1
VVAVSGTILDLFCGAGGAGVGYSRAGFHVIGVDIEPQPRYPFTFLRGDALTLLPWLVRQYRPVAIHASPPCQAYSVTHRCPADPCKHPRLVPAVRALLGASGRPWVMENVIGAPMESPVLYCGGAFGLGANCGDGVRRQLQRHRLFESNVLLMSPGCGCNAREKVGVYGTGGGWANRQSPARGGYQGNKVERQQAMGVDWMTIAEMSQAIPPAYTQHIGEQLMTHLTSAVAA